MKQVVGIDEVGRGPLAGPVTVCVLSCEINLYKKLKKNKNLPISGKDSKKLKTSDREKYEKVLKSLARENKISYSINHVSNKVIDSKGLSFAIKLAIGKGLENLKLKNYLKIKNYKLKILLDGGLRAPKEFKNQKTIKSMDFILKKVMANYTTEK